ncbi:MAG TPA: transporter [Pirellulales bacterium]|nr:transporter [Pirellulales bacterium]
MIARRHTGWLWSVGWGAALLAFASLKAGGAQADDAGSGIATLGTATELTALEAGNDGAAKPPSTSGGPNSTAVSHAVSQTGSASDGPAKMFRWALGHDDAAQIDDPEDLDADEIETDRPDFTQNRKTVGRGVVQLESGMTYLHGRKNAYNDYSFPETLLRVGVVADWLELRLSQNFGSDRTNEIDGRSVGKTGANDLVVGAKLAFTAQQGVLPEMGMILHTSVPSGSSGFNAGMLLPGINWLYGWDITERWSLAGSTQAYKTTDLVPLPTSRGGTVALDHVQHAFLVVAQSFSLECEVTDKLTPYFEWFLLSPSGALDATKTPQHYLDSGFTYKVTPNIQLDARAGMGLSHYSTALFAGSGLSVRY